MPRRHSRDSPNGTYHVVAVDGHRIAARDYGGRGTSVVLLHGGTGICNLGQFEHLARHLTAAGRVIAFDQRGHGNSPAVTAWGVDELLSDIDAVVRYFKARQPYLVGASWAGPTVLRYARSRPTRGVACVDAAISRPTGNAVEQKYEALAVAAERRQDRAAFATWQRFQESHQRWRDRMETTLPADHRAVFDAVNAMRLRARHVEPDGRVVKRPTSRDIAQVYRTL